MNFFLYLAHSTSQAHNNLSSTDIIQLAGVIATLMAVGVALFQEKIKEKFNKSKLKVSISLAPPDSHKIKMSDGFTSFDVIFIRIKVEHIGGDPAKNVEVMLVNCWEINGGKEMLKEDFIPLNLTWANQLEKNSNIKIPSGLFRYCDLGWIGSGGKTTLFHFETIVQPNGVGDEAQIPNELRCGSYAFELLVSGDNTDTIKQKWSLEFDGNWSDNQQEMLKKHIKIEQIN